MTFYFSQFKQNERTAQAKTNPVTPESRLILQQWLSSDYQLYNFFVSKLKEQLKIMGEKRVQQELNVIKNKKEKLKVDCNAHIVDNKSLKGTVG